MVVVGFGGSGAVAALAASDAGASVAIVEKGDHIGPGNLAYRSAPKFSDDVTAGVAFNAAP